MTAMTSPSWTTSPSETRSAVTVPALSASTGISIFIDSRITSVSPSATRVARGDDDLPDVGDHLGPDLLGHRGSSPRSCGGVRRDRRRQARPNSRTGAPDRSGRASARRCRCRSRRRRTRACRSSSAKNGRLHLGPSTRKSATAARARAEGLRAVGAVHDQLGQQRVVVRGDDVAGRVAGVDADARAGAAPPRR